MTRHVVTDDVRVQPLHSIDDPTGSLPSQGQNDRSPSDPSAHPSLDSSMSIATLYSEQSPPTSATDSPYTPNHTRVPRVRVVSQPTPGPPDCPPQNIDVTLNKGRTSGRGAKAKITQMARGFMHWLHYVWLDIFAMLLILAITYICLRLLPTFRFRQRVFPVRLNAVSLLWEGPEFLSYPVIDFVVPVMVLGVALPMIAIAVFAVMQIWVRNVWDFTAGVMGMLKGLIIISLLQVILKRFVGKLRPNFMEYCLPDFTWNESFIPTRGNPVAIPTSPQNVNFAMNSQWARTSTCTGSMTWFAMESFPSGHTASAFAVGVFLALYLNGKLKAFADYHTSFWKMVAVLAPVLGAFFVAGSLLVDHNHHPEDIVLSIPIGVIVALLAYRSHYASLFNYATNHRHLPWSSSHTSLDPMIPPSDSLDCNDSEKSNYRFRNQDNMAAVVWPRNHQSPVPKSNVGHHRASGTTDTIISTGGGVDGAVDERPGVPQSVRRRPRSEFLNHRLLAVPGSLRYRRSKAKYGSARRVVWSQHIDGEGVLGREGDATLMPGKAAKRTLAGVGGRESDRGLERRSAGGMV